MRARVFTALMASVLLMISALPAASAQELPQIAEPVAVSLEPGATAFLVLDLQSTGACPRRPACVASLPDVAGLLGRAREAGALVVHSTGTQAGQTFMPEVEPQPEEPIVAANADKFFNSALNDILEARGVKTVIIVGTAANGAVLYTSFGASLRGYTVVVAEDAISANDDFSVLFTRYQLLNQPGFANPQNMPLQQRAVTLSRTDLISFE